MTPRSELPDFVIAESGPLSRTARLRGYARFAELVEAIRALAYGRLRDSSDIAAVLQERRGTCSSKHRFLAALAHECGHAEIQLVLALYEMSESNTAGVGSVLRAEGLTAIPETHCYLACRGRRFDFTGLAAATVSPFDALIEEQIVSPTDLPAAKLAYHRAAIDAWARARDMDPQRAWAIRERCIARLTGFVS